MAYDFLIIFSLKLDPNNKIWSWLTEDNLITDFSDEGFAFP